MDMMAYLPTVPDPDWSLYDEYDYIEKLYALDIHSVYKKHIHTEISKGYMTITFRHLNNRSRYILLHGILIGGQLYPSMLIIPYLHPPDLHENIRNYIQYYLLHDSDFAHLCNK